jgi:hypothetical protein
MTPAKPPGVYTEQQAPDILDTQFHQIFGTAQHTSHTR